MSSRRRKHWGWDFEDQQPTRGDKSALDPAWIVNPGVLVDRLP